MGILFQETLSAAATCGASAANRTLLGAAHSQRPASGAGCEDHVAERLPLGRQRGSLFLHQSVAVLNRDSGSQIFPDQCAGACSGSYGAHSHNTSSWLQAGGRSFWSDEATFESPWQDTSSAARQGKGPMNAK